MKPRLNSIKYGLVNGVIRLSNVNPRNIENKTVEFYDNSLVVLTSTAINIKDISKEFSDNLIRDTETKLNEKDLTDHDRYVLNYKQDTIKEIKI